MPNYNHNIKILKKYFADFFQKSIIRKKFILISEANVTGWEKWFQIEFALFLEMHSKIASWDIEHRIRIENEKSILVDMCFSSRKMNTDFTYLEFKQNPRFDLCIKEMFKDVKRLNNLNLLPNNHHNVISKFAVGFFRKENKQIVFDFINRFIKNNRFKLTEDDYMLIRYNKTDWYLLIIQADKL